MQQYVEKLVKEAKEASYKVATLPSAQKAKTLKAMAAALLKNKKYILGENQKDLAHAAANNQSRAFIDRLTLTDDRIKAMSDSLKEIAAFRDPVGEVIKKWKRPNGLNISKVRSPIGVVLIVYEARPNVTSDCVGLLFKSSNVGILRGGKDAIHSSLAVAKVLQEAAKSSGIKFPIFFMVEKTDHALVDILLKQDESIDLVIPRGGEALIRKVVESSTIPVIKHYKGVCHIFVDKTVDLKQAIAICINAKVQRPSVCNAVEKILVHKDIAKKFLPILKNAFEENKVEMRGDKKSCAIIDVVAAQDKDWFEEYLDLIVTVGVVDNVEAAIAHINQHSSHHTESILTKNKSNADKFVKEVDSACCFVNISTRFADGGQFGLGAEIGISTDKLHARGPMGVEDLTTYKYIATGNGLVRK